MTLRWKGGGPVHLEDALAPYGMRPHLGHTLHRPGPSLAAAFERELEREMEGLATAMERGFWTDPSVPAALEAILVDDADVVDGRFTFPTEPLLPRVVVQAADRSLHGYDAIVTIAVMPLPPQPEIGNGDHEAWRRYILAMERRGHARALLDGICEGVWEQ